MNRTLGAGVILSLCLLPSLAWAQGHWSGTEADRMISSDDNEYARAVQIVCDQQILHAFWGEDSPSIREIHYGRSEDAGIAWTSSAADRVISFPDGNGVNPEECDAAAHPWGGSDILIVVWSEILDVTREVHYGRTTDRGLTWSSETMDQVLSDPATAADTGTPSIVCDHADNWHVVWQQASQAGTVEVFYSRSTDGGVTWSGSSADRMISFPDGNGTISPQIVNGEDGSLAVVWRETGDSGFQSIHLGMSHDGGDTWSSETADREISQPARLMTDLAASSAPFVHWHGIHVVYRASFDTQSPYYYEIYATSSYDNGVHWNGESGLVPVSWDEGAGRSASNPDVWVGNAQGPIAVWNEVDDLTGSEEQHISFGGYPWSGASEDVIISYPDDENGYRPSITGMQFVTAPAGQRLDGPFDTFVAWTEFAGGSIDNYEVHFSAASLIVGAADDPTPISAGRLRAFPNPSSGPVRIEWTGDAAAGGDGSIAIVDASGRLLRVLGGPRAASGATAWIWDRIDRTGRTLGPGVYFVKARIEGGERSVRLVIR